MSGILVYERKLNGHRRNYAETIARVLGARLALGPSRAALVDAASTRHLVVSTLESAPMIFAALVVGRALVGKRSTVIVTRWHVKLQPRSPRGVVRRLARRLLLAFESIQLLSITPPEDVDDPGRAPKFIEDIEFWDLPQAVFDAPPQSELAREAAAARQGRKAIVALGTLEHSKGLLFLDEVFAAHPHLADDYIIVCCGEVMEPSRALLEPLRHRATVWVDRFLSRDELLSLYAVADVVWCCYEPSYDVSSGVFGRALQLGRPTITRAGSIVARIAQRSGHGVSVAYGDVEAAAAALLHGLPAVPKSASRFNEVSARLRDIVTRHAGRERCP